MKTYGQSGDVQRAIGELVPILTTRELRPSMICASHDEETTHPVTTGQRRNDTRAAPRYNKEHQHDANTTLSSYVFFTSRCPKRHTCGEVHICSDTRMCLPTQCLVLTVRVHAKGCHKQSTSSGNTLPGGECTCACQRLSPTISMRGYVLPAQHQSATHLNPRFQCWSGEVRSIQDLHFKGWKPRHVPSHRWRAPLHLLVRFSPCSTSLIIRKDSSMKQVGGPFFESAVMSCSHDKGRNHAHAVPVVA